MTLAVEKAEKAFAEWYDAAGFACPPDSEARMDRDILRLAFLAGSAYGMKETLADLGKAYDGSGDRNEAEM